MFQVGDKFVVYKSSIPDEIVDDIKLEDNFGVFRKKSLTMSSVNGKISLSGSTTLNNIKIPRAQTIFQLSVFSFTKNNEVMFETFQ